MTITKSGIATGRRLEPECLIVEKPWGSEVVWAQNETYVGKILRVNAGKRLSLQYHDRKLETQCLLSGRAVLIVEDGDGVLRELEMETGKGYTIQPFQRHRLVALSDVTVLEVSTPEVGNTFRLEDDYARPDETEALRRDERGRLSPSESY